VTELRFLNFEQEQIFFDLTRVAVDFDGGELFAVFGRGGDPNLFAEHNGQDHALP